jgi:hypothetical protein
MSAPAPRPVFADLMAKLGYFLFYWSNLEGQLADSIREARQELDFPATAAGGSLSERLDQWRDLAPRLRYNMGGSETAGEVVAQVHALRAIRNTIIHGLRAGDARPDDGSPHIVCVVGGTDGPNRETVRYTLDDLEHFIQATDACRRAFIRLANFNYRLAIPPSPGN